MRAIATAILLMTAASAQAAKPVNWAETVASTPQGGILIGNPEAKVKLIEFGSFTCSHCRDFHKVGLPALKAKYISTGNVAYEFRSFTRNGPDGAASLIVGCQAAKPALGTVDALFTDQDSWMKPFSAIGEADAKAIAALPVVSQFGALAVQAGLDSWAAARKPGRGLAPAKIKACLADKAVMDQLVINRNTAVQVFGLQGTPTFVLDGKTVAGAYDWAALEPKLVEALR
ncbi:hypothetical protein GCM10011529_04610 [Polymorphobacter glacialis]|uniref:Thioredoxin-like fold domain-containing protein n=1 Tax=Sandarakinorhabdus glacialis TaxID=1614636 RepID=A0A916ZKA1_9SPHN|nr:thioredoxin domain-containing protein [Polymorphobacter glacialis]GGE01356.1 hypothetical protein GCM10011529_04610 [Polymorphobacter glacialis]